MRKTFLLIALLALAACDDSTSPTAPTPTNRDESDPIRYHSWELCAEGDGQWAPDWRPFSWSARIGIAGHDSVFIESSEARCEPLGTYADTTHFRVGEMGYSGAWMHRRWFRVDGRDSIDFTWRARFRPDTIATVSGWD